MRETLLDGHALARIQDQTVGDKVLGGSGGAGKEFRVQLPLARLHAESRVRLRLGEEGRFARQQSVDDGADGPDMDRENGLVRMEVVLL